jgi:hypothetical protein
MIRNVFVTPPSRRWRRQAVPATYRPRFEVLESRQLLSTNVLTYHNDLLRTGQNLTETTLTPDNVNASGFGMLYSYPVDGQVYAQPLYASGLFIHRVPHNVVFVATEHDSVYAIDADSGTLLWQDSFIDPANGINTFTQSDALGCGQITPEIGITATPVIDPIYNTLGQLKGGRMYVVDQFTQTVNGTKTYHQQLHVLNIKNGHDLLPPVEIQASVINDSGQTVTFAPRFYKERAALTLSNGILYTAWASHCDITPSQGWVIGYDAATLTQVSVFCTAPNGNLDTIWQGDGGLAVDPNDGSLYFETGNGTNILGHGDDYSEAFMKLDANGQTVDDYFIPANFQSLDQSDRDIGSGAPIALPDQPGAYPHLLVGAGKDGRIFLISRDNMGGLNNPPNGPDLIVQELPDGTIGGGSWDTPAYFDAGDPNGPWVYYAGNGDRLKAFQLTNGLFNPMPTSMSPTSFTGNYGATPIVTANGTTNGIVWALQNASGGAILHAYDATNLARELYNSNQNSNDKLGTGVKFTSPIVADGKAFVPGANYLAVFGLLGQSAAGGRGSVHPAAVATTFAASTRPAGAVPADGSALLDGGLGVPAQGGTTSGAVTYALSTSATASGNTEATYTPTIHVGANGNDQLVTAGTDLMVDPLSERT